MPQITVTYNCENGTFDFNPDPLQVPYQSSSTITWKVVGKKVPSGGSVRFPATGGITLPANWPGTAPAIDPSDSSVYAATDNNDGSNAVGDFKYVTTLEYNNGQGQTTNPTHDPDIQNEGPPATVSRQ